MQLGIVGPQAHHGHHDMAKVLCFTWNMGDAKPVDEELQYWLPSGGGRFVLSVLCPIWMYAESFPRWPVSPKNDWVWFFFLTRQKALWVMQVSLTWWLLESKSAATTGFRSGSQLRSAIPSDANL